jgi:hypothetical protein
MRRPSRDGFTPVVNLPLRDRNREANVVYYRAVKHKNGYALDPVAVRLRLWHVQSRA